MNLDISIDATRRDELVQVQWWNREGSTVVVDGCACDGRVVGRGQGVGVVVSGVGRRGEGRW